MKIIEPKVELWKQGNNAKAHIARCARVCYGNSGMSAPWEINLVQKLCDWDIISPLRFGYLNPYYRSAYNVSKRRK